MCDKFLLPIRLTRVLLLVLLLMFSAELVAQNEYVMPIVYVETLGGVEPTCTPIKHSGYKGTTIISDYVRAKVLLVQGCDTLFSSVLGNDAFGAKIKIRGNTSASKSKKPYKIKLEKKADMLGREPACKDKEWVLLAGDFKEQLKTIVGLQMNKILEMEFCPSWQFCRLTLNGEDKGVYLLVESVKRNTKCRLNIDTSGFFAELDAYWWAKDYSIGDGIMRYVVKYPDEDDLTDKQKTYIEGVLNGFTASIPAGSYDDYIDVKSFASWILGHDILGTYDSSGSNLFLVKEDNTAQTKLKMGPLWDFSGICRVTEWANQHKWGQFIKPLFQSSNTAFFNAYSELWRENRETYESSIKEFLRQFEHSDVAPVLSSAYGKKDYDEAVNMVNEWFDWRFRWIDKNISSLFYQRIVSRDDFWYDISGRRYAEPKTNVLYVREKKKMLVIP